MPAALHHESVDPLTAVLIGKSRRAMLVTLAAGPCTAQGLADRAGIGAAEAEPYLRELLATDLARQVGVGGDEEPRFALTSFASVTLKDGWIRIRVENAKGDFAQVTYRGRT